jgi:hypothetical protein
MFKLVTEDGVWLTDVRLSVPDMKPGDRIPRGRDTLEVVDVRDGGEQKAILVVRSRHVSKND